MAKCLGGISPGDFSRSLGQSPRVKSSVENDGRYGYVVSARTKRANESCSEQEHQTGEVSSASAVGTRISVSPASEGSSRDTGYCVPKSEEGRLRPWLLLASTPRVWQDGKNTTRRLDAKTAGEQAPRSGEPANPKRARMGLHSRLGMRPQRCRGSIPSPRRISRQRKTWGVVR